MNKRKKKPEKETEIRKFSPMLLIFSIIFQSSFAQTVEIRSYGQKIEMKKYSACHLYDYVNETSTIIVKVGAENEFLDIKNVQIGINHIYLPPEVKNGIIP